LAAPKPNQPPFVPPKPLVSPINPQSNTQEQVKQLTPAPSQPNHSLVNK